MATTDGPTTEFGRKMRHHRRKARITVKDAARIAELSEARWYQLERGYVSKDDPTPARPFPKSIPGIARALEWDLEDALTSAGYTPDVLTDEEIDDTTGTIQVPPVVVGMWPKLTSRQQKIVIDLMREFVSVSPRKNDQVFGTTSKPAYTSGAGDELVFSHAADRGRR